MTQHNRGKWSVKGNNRKEKH